VFTGIAYGMTDGLAYATVPSVFVSLGQGRISFLPYALILTMIISAIVAAALRWLPVGRELLAVGGNRDAARLAGLSHQRAVLIGHAASGLLAAVAALLYIGILQSATPASGSDWLITSFAVAIIGGTALTGGEAPVFGCFVAGLVLATINDALIVLNINSNAVELAEGVLVLCAVGLAKIGGVQRLPWRGRHRGDTVAPAAVTGVSRYAAPEHGGTVTS
jgi:ribose transport system permease protein